MECGVGEGRETAGVGGGGGWETAEAGGCGMGDGGAWEAAGMGESGGEGWRGWEMAGVGGSGGAGRCGGSSWSMLFGWAASCVHVVSRFQVIAAANRVLVSSCHDCTLFLGVIRPPLLMVRPPAHAHSPH